MLFYFGNTAKMLEMARKVRFIAHSREPVLIEGEGGTGKQTLAQYLHQASSTPGQLIRILCGHQNGTNGLEGFQKAASGTVFCKDVHLLPASFQERLLLALEDDGAEVPRLICSSCEGLAQLAAKGDFLPELFYRITAYRVLVPPLRDRSRDIPELFVRMMEEMQAGEEEKAAPPSPEAMEALCGYSWPGNLRELRNTVRNYLLAPDAASLMADIRHRYVAQGEVRGDVQLALKEQVRRASRRLEAEIILRSLERYRWNRRRTAQSLKISYRSLLYKMKECNIRSADESGPAGEEQQAQAARGPK